MTGDTGNIWGALHVWYPGIQGALVSVGGLETCAVITRWELVSRASFAPGQCGKCGIARFFNPPPPPEVRSPGTNRHGMNHANSLLDSCHILHRILGCTPPPLVIATQKYQINMVPTPTVA